MGSFNLLRYVLFCQREKKHTKAEKFPQARVTFAIRWKKKKLENVKNQLFDFG